MFLGFAKCETVGGAGGRGDGARGGEGDGSERSGGGGVNATELAWEAASSFAMSDNDEVDDDLDIDFVMVSREGRRVWMGGRAVAAVGSG